LARQKPYVLHVQGMPRRASLAHRPVHRRLFGPSLAGAAAVIAVSQAAADCLLDEFGLPAVALHNGVYTTDFATAGAAVARSEHPSVLFPADPDDERKRLPVLTAAVRRLQPSWPGLTLTVAAPPSERTRARLLDGDGPPTELLDVRDPGTMAAVYARAWVTCLPAVREAFGLVLVESLAAGTPAVGVRDGGVPEVLTERAWLAEPDDVDSLAAALDRALRAAQEPGVAERCARLAAPFDWSVRGPAFEALYRQVTGGA